MRVRRTENEEKNSSIGEGKGMGAEDLKSKHLQITITAAATLYMVELGVKGG